MTKLLKTLTLLVLMVVVILEHNKVKGEEENVKTVHGCFKNLQVSWPAKTFWLERMLSTPTYKYAPAQDSHINLSLQCNDTHPRLEILNMTYSIPLKKEHICNKHDALESCYEDSDAVCHCCTMPPSDKQEETLCRVHPTDMFDLTQQCDQLSHCTIQINAHDLSRVCGNRTDYCTEANTCVSRWTTIYYACLSDNDAEVVITDEMEIDEKEHAGGLMSDFPVWAIAIVAVVVLVLIIISVAVILIRRRRKKYKTPDPTNKPESGARYEKANAGELADNGACSLTDSPRSNSNRKKNKSVKIQLQNNNMYAGTLESERTPSRNTKHGNRDPESQGEENRDSNHQGDETRVLINNETTGSESPYDTPKQRYRKLKTTSPMTKTTSPSDRKSAKEDKVQINNERVSESPYDTPKRRYGKQKQAKTPKSTSKPNPKKNKKHNTYYNVKKGGVNLEDDGIYSNAIPADSKVEIVNDPKIAMLQSGEYSYPKSPPPEVITKDYFEEETAARKQLLQSGEYSTPKSPPPEVKTKDNNQFKEDMVTKNDEVNSDTNADQAIYVNYNMKPK